VREVDDMPVNRVEARRWLKLAADQGHEDAIKTLAAMKP
jgi:TPR repeat protein